MIQLSGALEANYRGRAVTVAAGWGFIVAPLLANFLSIIHQGQPGIRRYGIIALGFFVTAQFADMNELQKQVKRFDISALKRKLNSGTALPRR